MNKPKFEDYTDIFSYYDALEDYVTELEVVIKKLKIDNIKKRQNDKQRTRTL
jgi:hypothetical protein